VDDEAAAPRIHRGDHLLASDGVAHPGGERQVDVTFLEERGTEDDLARAGVDHLARAVHRPDPSADTAGALRRHTANQVVVVAGRHRSIEVDELDHREVLEAADPAEDVGAFDGDPVALDELDDFAAFQVDAGNEHAWPQSVTAIPVNRQV